MEQTRAALLAEIAGAIMPGGSMPREACNVDHHVIGQIEASGRGRDAEG